MKRNPIKSALTKKQLALKKKHGTPAEFAVTCYKSVPSDLNMDEARDAVDTYNYDWEMAGRTKPISYN